MHSYQLKRPVLLKIKSLTFHNSPNPSWRNPAKALKNRQFRKDRVWRNRRTPATLFVALLCLIGEVQPAAARVRAASINLCADQYLLALAPREDIVAVTPPAADPARSGEAARAAGIPVDHGTAEEIVRLKPDLVLADGFSDSATVALIRRLGIPVLVLPSPTSFEGIIANVRLAARALDRQEDGEELIRGVGASLQADARAEGAKAPPIVAALEPGGLIEGRGTLIDQAIRLAGGPLWAHPSVFRAMPRYRSKV